MNIKLFIFSLVLISCNVFCQTELEKFNKENQKYDYNDLNRVSIIGLIANPEKYDKKLISVEGYLKVEFEGTSLFLHKEDYEKGIYKNAIWVNIKRDDLYNLQKECNDKYATVIGIFDAKINGHMGMNSGAIMNIKAIYPSD